MLNTLNLRLFHPPLNPCNHFPTVLIKTNWYTISYKFGYCSNLSTLIIPSGLTSLSTLNEASIFEGSGIKSVYVAWPTPVPAGQFFYGFDVSQSTLYVPQGTRQDYWVAAVWEDFGDIQEYDVSAVNQPAHHSEAKEVSRYSLDGQRLTTPVKGLNIVRYSDGTIKKEAVH